MCHVLQQGDEIPRLRNIMTMILLEVVKITVHLELDEICMPVVVRMTGLPLVGWITSILWKEHC